MSPGTQNTSHIQQVTRSGFITYIQVARENTRQASLQAGTHESREESRANQFSLCVSHLHYS